MVVQIPEYPSAVRLPGIPHPRYYTMFNGKVLVTQEHPRKLGEQAIADIAADAAAMGGAT